MNETMKKKTQTANLMKRREKKNKTQHKAKKEVVRE